VATTVVSARSARRRRSSSQSAKYDSRAQLRDGDVQGAGAGVELPDPVAVPHVDPGLAALAVVGAANSVSLSRHLSVSMKAVSMALLPVPLRLRHYPNVNA
jgi:hypothetical protein